MDVGRRLGELDELAELAQRPHDRVLVLGDETEPLVVGVEQHEIAGLGVDGDLVRHPGIIEGPGPGDRRLRREPRREQCLELVAVLLAEVRDREPRVVGELG